MVCRLAEVVAELGLVRGVEEEVAEAVICVHDGDDGRVGGATEGEPVVCYVACDGIGAGWHVEFGA